MSLHIIKAQDQKNAMTPLAILEALSRDEDAVDSGWVREALAEAALDIRSKDTRILELEEQVASLQRVIRQHRDSDSQVDA